MPKNKTLLNHELEVFLTSGIFASVRKADTENRQINLRAQFIANIHPGFADVIQPSLVASNSPEIVIL